VSLVEISDVSVAKLKDGYQPLTQQEVENLFRIIQRAKEAQEKIQSNNSKKKKELLRLIEEGNKAKERIILGHLPLVVWVAKQFAFVEQMRFFSFEFSDLFQEGLVGLLKAMNKYDYRKGFHFSTYAVWWIRQSIIRSIDNNARLIRLPVAKAQLMYKILKAQNFEDTKKIAQKFGLSEEEVKFLLEKSKIVKSLDEPLTEDRKRKRIDFLQDPKSEAELECLLNRLEIESLLALVSPFEAKIIRERFGLGTKKKTLIEVGEDLDLGRESVRQLEGKILEKIRKKVKERKVDYWPAL